MVPRFSSPRLGSVRQGATSGPVATAKKTKQPPAATTHIRGGGTAGRTRAHTQTHTHTSNPRTHARACSLAHDDAFAARVPALRGDCRRQEIDGAAAAVVVEEEVTVEEGESPGAKVGVLKRKKKSNKHVESVKTARFPLRTHAALAVVRCGAPRPLEGECRAEERRESRESVFFRQRGPRCLSRSLCSCGLTWAG